MAKHLSDDIKIDIAIAYEPDILPSRRRIDFVLERKDDSVFIEVKSVHPNQPDNAATWDRYQDMQRYHPENVNVILKEDWLGGMIYSNMFASRSNFLNYTLLFEERLEEARTAKPGPGIIVFCGSGFHWDVSELEDFADYYLLGKHRVDDPFSHMEQHEIKTKRLNLLWNVDHFAYLKRSIYLAEVTEVRFPVRGPLFGR